MLVKHIKATHSNYEANRGLFKTYREAYVGGKEFKNPSNIRKFFSDRPEDYEGILNVTPITNICRQMIENRVNQVFEADVNRHLYFQIGGIIVDQENTAGLHEFLADCNLQGQSFQDFMEEIATQSSIYGHCWVYLDKPPIEEARPYVQLIAPQQVLDWEYDFVNGREILSRLKFIAGESSETITYVLCEEGDNVTEGAKIQTFVIRKDANDNQEVLPNIEVILPVGMEIPAVKCYGKKDPLYPEIGLSDIKDAVYFQRFIANLDREVYESVIYKKSILKLPSDVQTPEGGGLGIVRGEIDELSAVEFAVPDTADVDAVRTYIDNLLERYSNISGLQSQTGISARSGESFFQERKSLHKVAEQKARLLEVAEVNIFSIFAKWMGYKFAGYVEYDTDFEQRDKELKIYNLKIAKEIAPESQVIQGIIERELIKLIGSPEDIQAAGIAKEFTPVVTENPLQPQEIGEEGIKTTSINVIDNGEVSLDVVGN